MRIRFGTYLLSAGLFFPTDARNRTLGSGCSGNMCSRPTRLFGLLVRMSASDDRGRLIASHQAASDAFDRALMTLSAGSLGLSIAFVKDIARNPVSVWTLELSWILMGLSLLAIVTSFVASVEVHKRLIDGLDSGRRYDDEPRWVRHGVTWLNALAGLLFVAGAGFLITFAILNV